MALCVQGWQETCNSFAYSTNAVRRTQQDSWLRRCAVIRKIGSSILDVANEFFQCSSSFQPHYNLGVGSDCNRNEWNADNRIADCIENVESSTSTTCYSDKFPVFNLQ
jgi:hypothetical protein